jgi:TDG/mug DNA glycosylase family protein
MSAATSALEISRGFPPVVGRAPRVLLLGSLPGRASLAAGEYYAQRQNAFWRILGELCGATPDLRYDLRLAALKRAGIALWDVFAAAERPGSLDADIVRATVQVNDIAGLLRRHRSIALVGFNGRTAATVFQRELESTALRANLSFVTLPSTSPAHASLRPLQKLKIWRVALAPHLRAV